ncbi:N-carbamoyl-L-amino acid hydrolase [Planktothrix serta PCC 8927]|uniref:N-carbamoyl-L-amino acid hydrolase n=1 Tax=Planktothrix serta PCC 8927 TaxID=671068 RepID=A0A7Z9E0G5_9CYAN|nr:Zn-dependent hydrolase [Planktothrix serta]VXD19673.1 N-carbamoyl-L-amino acid hydrolase [Planktothrix serta PCC 8927]
MAVITKLRINSDRLHNRINHLAEIGQQPSGSICRLAFTPEDLQARQPVKQWMLEAGMAVRIDAAGNLIGRYPGKNNTAPVLATGSHLDTVPTGGRYDGVLGVLAGIEVAQTLKENGLQLHHPLEVIVFTDEESTMIGCQAMAGTVLLDTPNRYQPKTGESIQCCLERLGGSWEQLRTATRSRADMAAFVELHVEQGAILERNGVSIGIVQGVVGMQRQKITIIGQANHAGTTPMEMRQDALIAAAELILGVRKIALKMPSQPVATVGYINVLPNAVNIIPGQVELSVDMRDLSQNCLEEMLALLQDKIIAIADSTNTQILIQPLLTVKPSLADPEIQQSMKSVCQQLELSYLSLPSRAGHDALEMGRITDMGMIFVPSQGGISHSEAEYTSPEHCTQGANVLLQTLLLLDQSR